MENASELSRYYTVYLPDLPGFGRSQALVGDYYISELAEFVGNFADNLGLETFHLLGHSLGGGVALNYVIRFPDRVKRLVLVSSMCLGREIAWWVRLLSLPAFVKSIGTITMGMFRGVRWIVEKLFSGLKLVLPFSEASIAIGGAMTSTNGQTTVFVDYLSGIMAPTLLVWGAEDSIVPPTQAYAASQLIPSCEVSIFKDCGHSVHRQKTQEFSQLLARFLG